MNKVNIVSNFFNKVYEIVQHIPKGKVATYGQIASILGNPRGARTVGWAMKAAPGYLNLPCHRVVNKKGEMSPWYVFGTPEIQRKILENEGITFDEKGCVEMEKYLWNFSELEGKNI